MRLEQFDLKKSKMLGFLREATVVTNKDNKVILLETEKTYFIRKIVGTKCTFETSVQKDQPDLLNKILKTISKR